VKRDKGSEKAFGPGDIADCPLRSEDGLGYSPHGAVMRSVFLPALVLGALVAGAANAALKTGTKAPDFTTEASLGGKQFTFSLAEALKQGPVVLYFYPAAFTSGCTIEAHDFAEATDKFKAMGATVIGVSKDDIQTLHKFSVSECRSKFAVAADADQKIMKSYDAVLWLKPSMSNRTSYVISPDGEIIYSYSALNPNKHVSNLLAAVEQWNTAHGKTGAAPPTAAIEKAPNK
jgi:peroxiredoxin Q/BCP